MISTVINPIPTALAFLILATVFGVIFSLITKRIIISSVVASALCLVLFLIIGNFSSFPVSAFVRDLMYEPLLRNGPFEEPVEFMMAFVSYFGLPLIFVNLVIRFTNRRKAA